jgi:hypothetical protein
MTTWQDAQPNLENRTSGHRRGDRRARDGSPGPLRDRRHSPPIAVHLHLEEGATIAFSRDPRRYLPLVLTRYEVVELMNYPPFVYALDAQDVAVTGAGTLDGQADEAHWWKPSSLWCSPMCASTASFDAVRRRSVRRPSARLKPRAPYV